MQVAAIHDRAALMDCTRALHDVQELGKLRASVLEQKHQALR